MFSDERYIVLETFKKNGDSVKTPVWFVKHDDLIWIVTRELTGKVKRLRNNKNVNIAISNFSGKPKKEWSPGIAKKIEGELANEIIFTKRQKIWNYVKNSRSVY